MKNKLENRLMEYLVKRKEEEELEEMEREHKDETDLYCAYITLAIVAIGALFFFLKLMGVISLSFLNF